MSRKYTFTALALALGLVAGACSEQQVPTAADEADFTAISGPLAAASLTG